MIGKKQLFVMATVVAVFSWAFIGNSSVEASGTYIDPTPADSSYQSETEAEVKLETSDTAGGHYSMTNFDNSLRGWWRFEDNSDDDSGVSISSTWEDHEGFTLGRFGRAGSFNTTNSFDVTLNEPITGDFSISVWVYVNNPVEGAAVISNQNGHVLQIGGSSRWQFDNIYNDGIVAEPDTWVHLVCTYDSSTDTESLWTNAGLAVFGGGTGSINSTIFIGKRNDDIFFDGKIDELMIWNKLLSDDEIRSLYDGEANQYDHTFTPLAEGEHTFASYTVDTDGTKAPLGARTFTIGEPLVEEEIVHHSNSSGSSVHYGCKDPKALNYEYFAGSDPNLCKYRAPTILPSEFEFIKNLSIGMEGEDVRKLQEYLNTHGISLAASGPGSLGSESTFFGPLTKAALVVLQKTHNINPAFGFFGPKTRAFVNAK